MHNEKFYSIGLDNIRFYAALIVVIEHVNTYKLAYGLKQVGRFHDLAILGYILFFTLSGFLISYILLNEKNQTSNIDIKRFFFKRTLRIWPLYFIILGISFFINNYVSFLHLPGTGDVLNNLKNIDYVMLIAIMPHFLNVFIPYFSHTWSLGIEEMFYYFKPFLVKKTSNKKKKYLIILVITTIASELFFLLVLNSNLFNLENFNQATWALRIYNTLKYFGCITLGCLTAYTYLFFPKLKIFLFRRNFQKLIFGFIALLLILAYIKPQIRPNDKFYALLFSILIINLCFNQDTIVKLKNPIIGYLGKISYGIYIYHVFCIGIIFNLLTKLGNMNLSTKWEHLFLLSTSLLLTIGISHLSYVYIEKPISNLKKSQSISGKETITRPKEKLHSKTFFYLTEKDTSS